MFFKDGWSTLTIQTNGSQADGVQVYAAGYAEGILTRDLIQAYWFNDYQVCIYTTLLEYTLIFLSANCILSILSQQEQNIGKLIHSFFDG